MGSMYSHLCSSQWPHEVAVGATATIRSPSEPTRHSGGLVKGNTGDLEAGPSCPRTGIEGELEDGAL